MPGDIPEQPDQLKDVSAHSAGVGLEDLQGSLPTWCILQLCLCVFFFLSVMKRLAWKYIVCLLCLPFLSLLLVFLFAYILLLS